MDLCHLISATDTNGVIKRDGFNYSLSVVAEYILTYVTDVRVSQVVKDNDKQGLTIEGFTVNIQEALSTIRPTVLPPVFFVPELLAELRHGGFLVGVVHEVHVAL